MAMKPATSYLSQWYTFGRNRGGEVADVILRRPSEVYEKVIVNHDGVFVDFPGVAHGPWMKYYESKVNLDEGEIEFRTEFTEFDGGWICSWEVQPDGRYYGDEGGFGQEHCDEIELRAKLNEYGVFQEPFRIYSLGLERVTDLGNDLRGMSAEMQASASLAEMVEMQYKHPSGKPSTTGARVLFWLSDGNRYAELHLNKDWRSSPLTLYVMDERTGKGHGQRIIKSDDMTTAAYLQSDETRAKITAALDELQAME